MDSPGPAANRRRNVQPQHPQPIGTSNKELALDQQTSPRVPKRVAAVIINSLKGGVVPRIGLPYITVGRKREIEALLHDLALVADGGASFRFLVGRYGSGKSFLLQTIRNHAMGKGFVVCDADLSPERRLQGGSGQGLATYRELIRNLSTKTRPEGGALNLVLDRWISNTQAQVTLEEGIGAQDPGFSEAVEQRILTTVRSLHELVHGYDFARLLTLYWQACRDGDDELKANVTKWFRGEYRNKTEARRELGVNIAIGDDDWYDYLKLFAAFLTGAGYQGLVVLIDELVNLYKIPNAVSRQYNYEKILTMYNDTLQGKARHLGIIMSGTPQSIEDRRRGLYSYEALRSRLTQGRFAQEGLVDMLAPVIHLQPLTYEELLVLIEKLADIHAGLFGYERSITQDEMVRFLQVEFGRVGADTHLTPREVIRDFVEMLDILAQNPTLTVASLLEGQQFAEPVFSPVEQAEHNERAHKDAAAEAQGDAEGAKGPGSADDGWRGAGAAGNGATETRPAANDVDASRSVPQAHGAYGIAARTDDFTEFEL